jgi:hypothetical protein
MECVIKTAIDIHDNIQWQGLYVNGKKVIENYILDIDIAVSIFAPNSEYLNITVYEDDFSSIASSFPDEEDFSYLLDNKVLKVGDTVWLSDGSYCVSEVRNSYRIAGNYDVTEWSNNKPFTKSVFYTGHTIVEFNVKGKPDCFVWEDYSYQQSDLINFHKNKKIKKRA